MDFQAARGKLEKNLALYMTVRDRAHSLESARARSVKPKGNV